MKFRKKPIIIEAEQWFSGKQIEGVVSEMVGICTGSPRKKYFIDTLEGEMEVSEGDWIITGIAGERYPCKDSIFQATYDRIDEVEI